MAFSPFSDLGRAQSFIFTDLTLISSTATQALKRVLIPKSKLFKMKDSAQVHSKLTLPKQTIIFWKAKQYLICLGVQNVATLR